MKNFEDDLVMPSPAHQDQTTANDPKMDLLVSLLQECFSANSTHSRILNQEEHRIDLDTAYCPRNFDGFACWDDTPAGAIAYQSCPSFVVGFDSRRTAYKRCMDNGTWFVHPGWGRRWSNYTSCVDVDDLDFRNLVNNIYVGGYSLSVAAITISMLIFLYFKTLHCTRIKIHMHLFTSMVINNVLWIVWYKIVVSDVRVVQESHVWCQILHIVTNYFMVANYMWMFTEGLHLHVALVVVFLKEGIAMRCFIMVGWGVPLLLVGLYAIARYYSEDGTIRCWMDNSDTYWIITVPVLLSLIASFVFLANVVRVLLMKLHPAAAHPAPVAARKAVRAALILIPLFGLHYILIPFRPEQNEVGERVYQIVSAIITSLQGVCVAILFCFTNHDVVCAVRAQMERMITSSEGVVMTGITAGDSLVNTRDNIA